MKRASQNLPQRRMSEGEFHELPLKANYFKRMKTFQIHKIILFSLILSFLFTSCEDVVQVDIDNEDLDLISVEAYIHTQQNNNLIVKLEKSLPVDNAEKNPAIHNAIIQISDNEALPNTVFLVEDELSGIYILPKDVVYETKPGRTYKLTITTAEGVTITGEDYIQKVEPLDSVKVNLSSRGDYEFLGIFISSMETPGPGHYYKWDIYINGRLLYGSDDLAFANDDLVDGNYIYDLEIFTDWFDDEEEDEDGNVDSDKILFLGDTVQVVQSSISRMAYDFYLGMQNQAFSGSPFSVPPANLPNNLSSSDGKRVLGFFSARDASLGNMVIIDSTNYTPLESAFSY